VPLLPRRRAKVRIQPDAGNSIPDALAVLDRRFGIGRQPDSGEPVFVLASSWRSGSTLVQRLVMSSRDVLVWGEPYSHCALIRTLAESLMPFSDDWPRDRAVVTKASFMAPDRWVANAYPPPQDLIAAHRAFLDRLLADPARGFGFTRWGVKGVRLSGEHAVYLKYIFPDARIVFLHRNPYDAFLSYRVLQQRRPHARPWVHRWPAEGVSTAARFGEIWSEQTASHLHWSPAVDGTVLRYEDLGGDETLRRLAERARVPVDPTVARSVVGSSWAIKERSPSLPHLTDQEIQDLGAEVEGVAGPLGYHGPSERRS
jgi:hypothetical protein